jgi:hypothetical protein
MKAFRHDEDIMIQDIDHINASLKRIEKMCEGIHESLRFYDYRIEKLSDKIDKKTDETRKESWSQFRWLVGILIALFVTIVTVLIKGHVG